jgi:uncharacterized protein (DUF1501 family)
MCEKDNLWCTNDEHEKEHDNWSRRGFIKTLGLSSGIPFFMSGSVLNVFKPGILSMALNGSETNRILLLIRLKGGNDGLNTVIPLFDFSRYQALRPGIAINQANVLNLGSGLGLHPAMGAMKSMWDTGALKVINNVGYPDQNLSHFRSADIWASASNSNVVWDTGFLGRFFEDQYPDFLVSPPETPPAVQIGGLGNLAFSGKDSVNYAVTVASPELLQYIAEQGSLFDAVNVPDCFYGDQVAYLRTVANNTFKYADVISRAYQAGENKTAYTGSFGQQLAITSRLIKGKLGTKLYMVTLDGFDTHAAQPGAHTALLQTLSDNLQAFYNDLAIDGFDQDVLSFTFSEFGRRIQQNASLGTDHGAAAPMFVAGPALEGNGLLGGLPSLTDLDQNGNLKHQVDFRSIYAALMEYWLCIEPNMVDLVLGDNFSRLNLEINCLPNSTIDPVKSSILQHEVRYDRNEQAFLFLKTPTSGHVNLELFTATGQRIRTFAQVWIPQEGTLIPLDQIPGYFRGFIVYSVHWNNKLHSGKALLKK